MTDFSSPTATQPFTPGRWQKIREGLSWRWRFVATPRLKRLFGIPDVQWGRVVSDRDGEEFVRSLDPQTLDVVEISSTSERWRQFPFKSHVTTSYPEYDLCAGPLRAEAF